MPPKTPRTKAASKAPTTGHADSPVTIVIHKKLTSTPALLPRKGRKSIGVRKVCVSKYSFHVYTPTGLAGDIYEW